NAVCRNGGDPGWIRTSDPQLRRLVLYPAELLGRLGTRLWERLNSITKYSFLSSGHLRRHCNVSVAVIVGSLTIHSSIKLASNDWQARKNPRSSSRRRPAVLRSAHPTPDPHPGDRAVVVEGWPACRRNRQPELGHGGRSDR